MVSNDAKFSIRFGKTRDVLIQKLILLDTNIQAYRQCEHFIRLTLVVLQGESRLTKWPLLKVNIRADFLIIHHEAILCSYICRPDSCAIQLQHGTAMKPVSPLLDCDNIHDGLSGKKS